MIRLFKLSNTAFVILVASCTTPSPPSPKPIEPVAVTALPHPSLMLIGGGNYHKNDDLIAKTFLRKITEKHKQPPTIGVVTAASEPAEVAGDGAFYETFFKDLGAHAEWLDLNRANSDAAYATALVKRIDSMNAFFFGGGDQRFIIQALFKNGGTSSPDARHPTPVMAAIQRAYARGAVYAGTSAGSVVGTDLGIPMFLNGGNYASLIRQRWSANPSDAEADPQFNKMVVDTQGGLGFFRFGSIDTHFNERNREVRSFALGQIMQKQKTIPNQARIFGIDEGTVLMVDDADTDSAQISVLGAGGVTIVDFAQASFSQTACFAASGVKISYLTDGDSYDPISRQVTFNKASAAITFATKQVPAKDVTAHFFGAPKDHESGSENSPGALSRAAEELTTAFILSPAQTLRIKSGMTTPQFQLIKSKTGLRSARRKAAKDTSVSYQNMSVELSCRE